jgi:alditol oxidase
MNKRTFIKISSALVAGAALSPLEGCKQGERPHNWAGNLEYGTDRLFSPKTIEEVQELVKKYDKLKVQGTRHSFNKIADSTDNLVSLVNLNEITINKDSMTVTVGAGVNYGQLARHLFSNGYAVHNLASLPHISIAGACATGTHGSGVKNGNLSTAVSAIELVNGSGDLVTLSREKDGDTFLGAVVGLGALGLITKTTLDIQPTFNVRQDVYENLPLDQLKDNFEEVMSAGYSVSLFTDWQNKNVSQVWIKRRVEEGALYKIPGEFFQAKIATRNMHPITALSAENCTEQMGVAGPWHERLPHFKMDFTPSSGVELQSEYFVPRENGYEALLAVEELSDQIGPHLLISEIRTIDGDNLWMSMCYQRPSMAIHFTWKQDWPAVKALLPKIEEKLARFNARPHWAKLFSMDSQKLASVYSKLPDFQKLMTDFDLKGKFRNEFLDTTVFDNEQSHA